LSVREEASKTLAELLSRSSRELSRAVFFEIITRLRQTLNQLPVTDESCFEAEGLFQLLCLLVQWRESTRPIPSEFFLTEWPAYYPVIEMAIGHPASSVRQISSQLLMHIMKRGSSSGTRTLLTGLVAQSMSAGWLVDATTNEAECFYSNEPMLSTESAAARGVFSAPPFTAEDRASKVDEAKLAEEKNSAWEVKEGKMLTYELILNELIANHFEANDTLCNKQNTTGSNYIWSVDRVSKAPRLRTSRSSWEEESNHNPTPATTKSVMTPRISIALQEEEGFQHYDTPLDDSLCRKHLRKSLLRRENTHRQTSILENILSLSGSASPTGDDRISRSESEPEENPKRVVVLLEPPKTPPFVKSRPRSASLSWMSTSEKQNEPWRHSSSFSTIQLMQNFEQPVPEPFPCKLAFLEKNEIHSCSRCGLEQQAKLLKLVPFSWVFVQMLLHTTFCALSSRWELRRMADQVYPSLIEVFCRFDFKTLRMKWIQYLKPESSGFLKFTALLSLKHCLRLAHDYSRREIKNRSKNVCEVLRCMRHLDRFLPEIGPHVLRTGLESKYNRFRVLVVDIILSLNIWLDGIVEVEQYEEQMEFVLNVLEGLHYSQSINQLELWILGSMEERLPTIVRLLFLKSDIYKIRLLKILTRWISFNDDMLRSMLTYLLEAILLILDNSKGGKPPLEPPCSTRDALLSLLKEAGVGIWQKYQILDIFLECTLDVAYIGSVVSEVLSILLMDVASNQVSLVESNSQERNFREECSGWDSTSEEEKAVELVPAIWEFITLLREKHRGDPEFLNAISKVDPRISSCEISTNIFHAVRARRKRLTYRIDCSGINHQSKVQFNRSNLRRRRYTLE